jgi:hypothetical protein
MDEVGRVLLLSHYLIITMTTPTNYSCKVRYKHGVSYSPIYTSGTAESHLGASPLGANGGARDLIDDVLQ